MCELSINSNSEIDFKKIKNYRLAKYLSKVSYEDTNCRSRIFIIEFRQAFSFLADIQKDLTEYNFRKKS